jgi:dCMP deaminase
MPNENPTHRTRPDWTNYFLGLAKVASQRSHDIHTQHGCVITDRQNRILGVGYNGFPKGMHDKELPLERPAKYAVFIHSEINSLANCVIRPDNAIAYVTGQCCNNCAMTLWQNGITKIVMAKSHGTHLFDENQQKLFDQFVKMTGIEIEYFEPNYDWLKQLSGVL